MVSVTVVSLVTLLKAAGVISKTALAASPAAIGHGGVWLLFTSAMLVDHPVVVSLVAFAALGIATLVVCGSRVL